MTSRDAVHPAHSVHQHEFSEAFAEHLDLEALLATTLTMRALDRAASVLDRPVHTVLDLGSGTGAGTVALARRFPEAQVHCLDLSTELLDRLTDASASAGIADRVISCPPAWTWSGRRCHCITLPTRPWFCARPYQCCDQAECWW